MPALVLVALLGVVLPSVANAVVHPAPAELVESLAAAECATDPPQTLMQENPPIPFTLGESKLRTSTCDSGVTCSSGFCPFVRDSPPAQCINGCCVYDTSCEIPCYFNSDCGLTGSCWANCCM